VTVNNRPGSRADSRGSADSDSIAYRADIDGLRAIAVLSVVFFHFSKFALPGGYLGVDMFFVVSGYLISAIIWRELREGRFSIVRFYDRRIRRITPALMVLLLFTTMAASAILLPADLIGYAKSLLATLLFSANIYFWRDTNYFSAAAEQKPLLHLWSLGVEEQFYLLFPLILALLARWWPRFAPHAVALLAIGSLTANLLAGLVGANIPAFFLLPTRAWELGIGAAIAMSPAGRALRPISAAAISLAGALLIILGLLFPIDTHWFYPAAAPIVVGTTLLIVAGRHDRPTVNRLLQLRPVVFVGLISYSLYLWHWPVIVLCRYYLIRPFTLPEAVAALAVMTGLATASWRFIERPFRSREMPIQRVRALGGVAGVALAAGAAALLGTHGLPGRLSAQAALIDQAVDTNYRCPISDYLAFGASHACAMNLPSRNPRDAEVILLGNSHAQMYTPVWISILAEHGAAGLLVPATGCLPTVTANISPDCIEVAETNVREILNLPRARTVIVGLTWWHAPGDLIDRRGQVLDNTDNRSLIAALDDLIDRLRDAGKQVVLIGPIAEPGWDVASTMSRELAFGRPLDRPPFSPASEFERRFGSSIRHFESREDVRFARPDRIQCPADRCYYVIDGRSLFSDGNHIAAAELPRFRAMFDGAISAIRSPGS
jgi:peptidoglycan/LPS O-acetylase OafA/YrhL